MVGVKPSWRAISPRARDGKLVGLVPAVDPQCFDEFLLLRDSYEDVDTPAEERAVTTLLLRPHL